MTRKLSLAGKCLVVIAFAGIWLAGCSDDNNNTTGPAVGSPVLLAVTPPSGATNVPPTDSITMKFNMPMDTTSVRMAFHLAGGPEMLVWMDSLAGHMGGMGHMMNMGTMMQWMDTIQYGGSFHWNNRRDSVTFVPDSMHANSQQLMYLYGNVRGSNGQLMVMDTFTYGGYMQQFKTTP